MKRGEASKVLETSMKNKVSRMKYIDTRTT
jgi:hypothetical protein